MSIVLKRGMLLSDRLYKPGDTLPDIEEARILAERGDAKVIDETPAAPLSKPVKAAKVKPAIPDKPETKEPENGDGAGNS